jgi:hypothetical protein
MSQEQQRGATPQIRATTQARASQKQKEKHNLQITNYKPCKTKQKTKLN